MLRHHHVNREGCSLIAVTSKTAFVLLYILKISLTMAFRASKKIGRSQVFYLKHFEIRREFRSVTETFRFLFLL